MNGIEAEWTTDRSNYDRCISTGVLNSITPKIYNSGSRIVQGPGWLAFQNEMIHETRVIPTDGRRQVGAAVRNWMGTSVGRWEGDVLVVETRNIKPESVVNGQPLSDEGVLIERFTLADANTLDYRMTVNDPKVYTAPWTLRLPIPREESYGYFEYGCHEGNYAMPNLLAGSRAEEKRRAEAVARGEKIPEYVEPTRGGGAGARRRRRRRPRRQLALLSQGGSSASPPCSGASRPAGSAVLHTLRHPGHVRRHARRGGNFLVAAACHDQPGMPTPPAAARRRASHPPAAGRLCLPASPRPWRGLVLHAARGDRALECGVRRGNWPSSIPLRNCWRSDIKYIGVVALPVAWIGFVLDFVARDRAVVRRVCGRLAAVAAIALVTAWTNEWHGLFWGPMTLHPVGDLYTFTGRGPGFFLNIVYTYGVLFAGLAILVAQAIQSPYLYRKRTVILVLADRGAVAGQPDLRGAGRSARHHRLHAVSVCVHRRHRRRWPCSATGCSSRSRRCSTRASR